MKLLVTGGAGFIGSAYIRRVLATQPADEITTLDALTYAGNLANLDNLPAPSRHQFVHGTITDASLVDELVSWGDAVVNFAAETHVDRSLQDFRAFLASNVEGTYVLLDAVRRHGRRLVQVSTDDVYGDIPDGQFSTEGDPLVPRSSYAAAKASADLFCHAASASFGTDVVITRGCNTLGPRQHPEKLVPLFITNALRDQPLPVYGDGLQVRDWLHVDDHAAAVDVVLRRGTSGEVYNVGAGNDRTNIEVTRAIIEHLGRDHSLISHVADRPGHDRRYALDSSKIHDRLGWRPVYDFEQALHDTIDWYVTNQDWWMAIRDDSAGFGAYYERQYGSRLRETSPDARRGTIAQ